jgi:hypothetical protein
VSSSESQGEKLESARSLHEFEESLSSGKEPFSGAGLLHLFFRPKQFFTSGLAIGKMPYVLLVTWCVGISSSIDRIDSQYLKATYKGGPLLEFMEEYLGESWFYYWGYVLVAGALNGLVIWWLGGWWYRKRLKWSSCIDPSKKLSRLVLIYSSFVSAGPAVVTALIASRIFSSYIDAAASESMLTLLLLAFPFWSVVVSYRGATNLFEVSLARARLWFLILPSLTYVFLLGLVAVLFSYLEGM